MDHKTTIEEKASPSGIPSGTVTRNSADVPVFSALIQTATRELLASLQLLAERSRCLTGATSVAIALDEDGQFVYCASAGRFRRETGTTADMQSKMLRECIATQQPVRPLPEDDHSAPNFAAAVPVIRRQKVAGFFELTNRAAFADNNVQAVSRISEFVNTALDHVEAAEHAENRISNPDLTPTIEPAAPPLWHANERTQAESSQPQNEQLRPATIVHACKSCGFPVSQGRTLCLDCEQHSEVASTRPAKELFAIEKQECWLSAHGYTIASLLLTALAAAIILWLR